MQRLLNLAAILLLACPLALSQVVPSGTVIPVMLTTTLDSTKEKTGQLVAAKVMQAVPLPSGEEIPSGAMLLGHVVQVQRRNGSLPSLLAVQFDKIVFRGREQPIHAHVRALASMMAVYEAQVPLFEPDTTPRSAVLLAPVGGEAAFQPDNPERSRVAPVPFSGDPPPGCGGRIDRDGGTGALWVFSPYACGVYGFGQSLVIANDGSTAPPGTIVLASRTNVSVHAGSGWLLRVESLETPAITPH